MKIFECGKMTHTVGKYHAQLEYAIFVGRGEVKQFIFR